MEEEDTDLRPAQFCVHAPLERRCVEPRSASMRLGKSAEIMVSVLPGPRFRTHNVASLDELRSVYCANDFLDTHGVTLDTELRE